MSNNGPNYSYDPRIGDTVQLRSGGPHLTVLHEDKKKLVLGWFDDKEFRQAQNIPVMAVMLVEARQQHDAPHES